MLDYLKDFKNDKFDFLTFLEGNNSNMIHVECNDYNEPGEPIGGSPMGDAYHIILFRSHETEDKYTNLDFFEAILVDPLEYMSNLIPQGWYGIFAKKTTTSQPIINRLLDRCKTNML